MHNQPNPFDTPSVPQAPATPPPPMPQAFGAPAPFQIQNGSKTPTVPPTAPQPNPKPSNQGKTVLIVALIAAIILIAGGTAAALTLSRNGSDNNSLAQQRIEGLQDQLAELESAAAQETDAPTATTAAPVTTTTAPPATTAAPTTTTTAPPPPPPTTAVPTSPVATAPPSPSGYVDISDVERAIEGMALLEAALAVEREDTVDSIRLAGAQACNLYESDPDNFESVARTAWSILVDIDDTADLVYGGEAGWLAFQDRLLEEYCSGASAPTPAEIGADLVGEEVYRQSEVLFVIGDNPGLNGLLEEDPIAAEEMVEALGRFYCFETQAAIDEGSLFLFHEFSDELFERVRTDFPDAPEVVDSTEFEFHAFLMRLLITECAETFNQIEL